VFCPQCGKKINDDTVFCPFCGSEIFEDERPNYNGKNSENEGSVSGGQKDGYSNQYDSNIYGYTPQSSSEGSYVGEDEDYGEELPEPPKKKKNGALVALVLGVACALALLVILISNFNHKDNKEDAEVTETPEVTATVAPTATPSETPTPTPTSYVTMYVVNTGDFADMHASASDSSSVLTQITLGTAVNYIEDADNGYAMINYKYQDGYIKKSYLSESEPSSEALSRMKILYCSDSELISQAESKAEDQYLYLYGLYQGAAYGADYDAEPYVDSTGKEWYPVSNQNIQSIADLQADFSKRLSTSASIPNSALAHYREEDGQLYTDCEEIKDDRTYQSISITGVSSRTESQAVLTGEINRRDSSGNSYSEPFTYIMVPDSDGWKCSAFQYSGF